MWELGLGDLGITTCSPWLFDANLIITNGDPIWEIGLFATYHLPNTADAPYVGSTGGGVPRTNFPYGIPVQPNVPV